MKKAICPITGKYFECLKCNAPKDDRCPFMQFDECIQKTLKFIREVVENESKTDR
jgi:hypothetical protein